MVVCLSTFCFHGGCADILDFIWIHIGLLGLYPSITPPTTTSIDIQLFDATLITCLYQSRYLVGTFGLIWLQSKAFTNLYLNRITAMFSMARSKMTVVESILDIPPSNLPSILQSRLCRVTSTVGLAHWTLTCNLWPLWYSYRGHEAAACMDPREHAEGAPRALYAGRHCVSIHTQTHSKYVTDAGWCSGKHTRTL